MESFASSQIPFVHRPNEYERLVAFLLDQRFFLPVALTTSLPGGRGFGRTALARAVCQDPRVREAFADGIAWVTMGSGLTPLDMLSRLEELIYDLTGEHTAPGAPEEAEARLHELLHPLRTLLVIDEADDEAALGPFLKSGPGGACLLITHNDACLPVSARRVPVDIMMPEEAVALLLGGLPEIDLREAPEPELPPAPAAGPTGEEGPAGLETRPVEDTGTEAEQPIDGFPGETPGLAPDSPAAAPPADPRLMALVERLSLRNIEQRSTLLRRPVEIPAEARERVEALADRLNDWPLLLSLVHGLMRGCYLDSLPGSACVTLISVLDYAKEALDREELAPGWRIDDPAARQRALDRVIAACLAPLSEGDRERCRELSVFSAMENIPLAAVETLWQMPAAETRQVCRKLALRGLITLDEPAGVMRMQSAVCDTLRDHLWAGQLITLHNRLVYAYEERCPEGWASGPDDGYFFQHLIMHLDEAGRKQEMRDLLFDYDWVSHYLSCSRSPGGRPGDLLTLLSDYERALSTALDEQSAELRLVQDALRMSAGVLVQDPSQLAPQLLGRLLPFDQPNIRRMIDHAKDWQGRAWLRPLAGCFAPPGGDEVRVLTGHDDWLTGIALLADGQHAFTSSLDGSLRMWDLATGQVQRHIQAHEGGASAVRVTPDGQLAVSCGWDGMIRVWNAVSGQEVRSIHAHLEPIGALLLTPDGKRAISGADDRLVRVWDLETGEMKQELLGHSDLVRALAITPDGRTLISGSWDYTLRLWDLENGTLVHILTGHEGWVRSVAVSPDGYFVLSGAWDGTVRVWDLWTGETVRMAEGFAGPVFSLAITPDNKTLITGGGDGEIDLWDFATMERGRRMAGHTGGVNDLLITPGGRFLLSGSDDRSLRIWDLVAVRDSGLRTAHAAPVSALANLPGGQRVITGSLDGTLKIWEPAEGRLADHLTGHDAGVLALAVTPDGRMAVTGSRDCTLRQWNLETGSEIRKLIGHEHPVTAVAISPDGDVAVSGDDDGVVRVWTLENGECLAEFRGEGSISGCVLSPDGRTVTVSEGSGKLYFLEIQD